VGRLSAFPQPQMQAAITATMTITVPEGAAPGTMLQIQPPQGGLPVQVMVPAGYSPGQSFTIQVPVASNQQMQPMQQMPMQQMQQQMQQ
jgi:hypothetical protein